MKFTTNKLRLIFVTLAIVAFVSACQSGKTSKKLPEGVHEVVVKEVIQTSGYSYLLVKENEAETWLAVELMEAKAGETYYYKGGFMMKDFRSKELNRTFAEILFLDNISKTADFPNEKTNANPHGNAMGGNENSMQSTGKKTVEKVEVKIDPIKGGVTVADLFTKKADYSGKTVKIKAKVVKFSPEIMKKNWIHLQDGTDAGGKFDLTATSDMTVNEGDIITIEGKVSLDKDFGYGYFYDVIIEDAKLIK